MWLYAWLLRKRSNGYRLPEVGGLGMPRLALHGIGVLEVAAWVMLSGAQQVLVS